MYHLFAAGSTVVVRTVVMPAAAVVMFDMVALSTGHPATLMGALGIMGLMTLAPIPIQNIIPRDTT